MVITNTFLKGKRLDTSQQVKVAESIKALYSKNERSHIYNEIFNGIIVTNLFINYSLSVDLSI